MHIIFLNPQGNFDQADSYLAEHPDFGGQLVYVKEVAQAMVDLGHRVDIVTRLIQDKSWPEFSAELDTYSGYEGSLRILRFSCGGSKFLEKEQLWPHMPEFVDNMLKFYADKLPDFATGHYADGGYCAVLARQRAGLKFTFTGHSLGAQKMDKLGTSAKNWEDMNARFHFSKRISAERLSMKNAARIIVSTGQEQKEQYTHPLYEKACEFSSNDQFSIIAPGVNGRVFSVSPGAADTVNTGKLNKIFGADERPVTVVSSRLDEKKNIIGVVRAYAKSKALQERASLVICIRGIDKPEDDMHILGPSERLVLEEIMQVISEAEMRDNTYFLNIGSQAELAATYRYFADRGSVFALTSFYEPFGLAPIEAAATGLATVTTKNGGPSDIFSDGSGILVDPFSEDDIARGIIEGLTRQKELSLKAISRVKTKYTWEKTAENYMKIIAAEKGSQSLAHQELPEVLDASKRIEDYLNM